MNTPNSNTSSDLGTPLSLSFTNINSLVHNLISKPTFNPFNLEQDIDQVLQALKRQCEEEYVKLNEIRSKLKHFETPVNALSEEEKRVAIMKAEEKRLDEEIVEQKKNQRNVTTKPHVLRELSVMKEVHQTIENYQNILPRLHKEINEIKNQIIRERDTLNESEIIHDTLLDKLKKLQQNDGSMTQKSEIGDIKEKINTVRKDFDILMDELRKFADTNFPPQEMIENSDDLENENERMLSLRDMLEDLMNQTYSNPNNPYLKFDPGKVWNPYVETLIRAGIAKRHPNDANMLKLVEFHL
ncbi:10379_t:CDS:2 [Funneliformis mosseae]|uniref:10379_t:CDS:1 n=1 Tax=Funneliformis mosseae TaxID=27381 RepID=A0A9N9HM69_FUNMO|nr:10379_t:CDS:2 [Funneliformis mosseae]